MSDGKRISPVGERKEEEETVASRPLDMDEMEKVVGGQGQPYDMEQQGEEPAPPPM